MISWPSLNLSISINTYISLTRKLFSRGTANFPHPRRSSENQSSWCSLGAETSRLRRSLSSDDLDEDPEYSQRWSTPRWTGLPVTETVAYRVEFALSFSRFFLSPTSTLSSDTSDSVSSAEWSIRSELNSLSTQAGCLWTIQLTSS